MTRYQWIISIFIIWHFIGFGAGSIASPEEIDYYETEPGPANSWLSQQVRPIADTAAVGLGALSRSLWHVTTPARVLTEPYSQAVAIRQRWIMFVVPDKTLGYVRMRYYWNAAGSEDMLRADELVFPRDREDEVKLAAAYWNSFHSKAVSSSLVGFFRDRSEGRGDSSTALTPVISFFREQFEETHLAPGEQVSRTEFWHGVALNPPPGERLPAVAALNHLDTLRAYYEELAPTAVVPNSTFSERGSVEQQADIFWTLLDLQEDR